ncbi:MAG: serine/threonine protein phosphatase [Thermoanaerobaculaceae bacterium]|nr:serine/threonine protein phosphatase [Thermoanaerobaculaceae bacterium]MDI9623155.1 metallophosphoesterase family protein [Acidobacteriota bacterium]NLH09972.1 serine/threonine protein phosphatase [Holophagae bacterium]HPW54531.1 metallophosphoesterase family protein [Thermoanaerobaculaceae bacterium]
MRRLLVVGDIHGCFHELEALRRLVELGPADLLVSVGDLVDRGPASFEVVRYFAADPVHRLAVLGNHEEKHLRGDRHELDDPSGRITRTITRPRDYETMLEYFRTLPLYLDLPEALVVHAGLLPNVPLAEQPPKVLTGRGSQGRPGFDGATPWWFDDPTLQPAKPVIFGHSVFSEVVRRAEGRVWGLDTGAAVGGRLSGLLLPELSLVSVPTPDYYRELLRHFAPVFLLRDLPHLPWRRVLGMRPEDWPDEVARRLVHARHAWRDALAALAADVGSLRALLGWEQQGPDTREAWARALRSRPELGSPYSTVLLHAFPGGPDPAVVAKAWSCLAELEKAVAYRHQLDLAAIAGAVGGSAA